MPLIKRFLYFCFSFFVSFANAEIIEKININGLDTISRGTLLSYLSIEVGEDVSQDLVNKSLFSLKNTNFFKDITIKVIDKTLIVDVVENPTIKYFEYRGFKEDEVLSEEVMNKALDNYKLNIGKIFIQDNLNKLLGELSSLYKINGYYDALIKVNSDIDEKNRIGIELIFEENDRALIDSFKIKGSNAFSEEELLDLFEIGPPDFFLINYFSEKDNFSKLKFDAGIQKLETKYLESGFLDFSILDKKITLSNEDKKINIELIIDEGNQYSVGEILFSGDMLSFSEGFLRSKISVKKGDIFKRQELIKDLSNLEKLYKNEGYAYTSISPKTIKTAKPYVLDLQIPISSKKLIYINRINISGNTTTQDSVIRRKLSILEGQTYSKVEIDESIRAIKRLGYFSDVSYVLVQLNDQIDRANINIDVTEQKTGEISIGLSHANATGASINAGISQNNIFGTGNTINASFSNSDAVEELSFYFKNPHINKYGHSISYGFFDKTIDANNLDTSSYVISESGLTFGYGIPFSDISNFFIESRLSSLDLKCGSALSSYESNQCLSPNNQDMTLSFHYVSNSLDDFYFASTGSVTSLKFLTSLPFADSKYFKIEGVQKTYLPVFDTKTLKLSMRTNFATGYGDDNLPFYKRYFEGGSSSIRGFDFNSLGAKYPNGNPKGGELSIVSTAGLASSMKFLGVDNPNIKIMGFVDAGTISEKLSDFQFNDLRSSTGVAFSWLTPIGPIGLNFAKPIIKKDGDKTKTFSFELGTKF